MIAVRLKRIQKYLGVIGGNWGSGCTHKWVLAKEKQLHVSPDLCPKFYLASDAVQLAVGDKISTTSSCSENVSSILRTKL